MPNADSHGVLQVRGGVEFTRGVESGQSGLAEAISRIFAPVGILVPLI